MPDDFLTPEEFKHHREEVRAFMRANPAYQSYSLLALPHIAIALSVALVFAGAGASFAAEYALPGEVLYPVKVTFNEEVARMWHVEPEARAEFEAEQVEERLTEISALLAEEVDQEAWQEARASFSEAVLRAGEALAALAQEHGAEEALPVGTGLEDLLENHKAQFASSTEELSPGLESLIADISEVEDETEALNDSLQKADLEDREW